MLPKVSFTPEGVQDKIAQVYALSDPDLVLQANAVNADFPSWMDDNFTLDTDQQTYLNGLSSETKNYIGNQLYYCFLNRLPVILIQNPPVLGYDKWLMINNTVNITANGSGDFSTTGAFIFTIYYQ